MNLSDLGALATPAVAVGLAAGGWAMKRISAKGAQLDQRLSALERTQATHGRTLARIEGYLDGIDTTRARQREHRRDAQQNGSG